MITTRNEALYQRLLRLRSHGITRESSLLERKDEGGWYYEMQELGYNYRLTDLQCALGASQLMRAEAGLARRLQLARQYHALLADIPWLKLPAAAEGVTHAWHLYVVWTQRRKELYDWLRQCGIYAQVHYVPVHLHPYYRAQGWREGDFPVAETYYSGCLSIPMYPTLRDDEQEYVAACIRQFGGS